MKENNAVKKKILFLKGLIIKLVKNFFKIFKNTLDSLDTLDTLDSLDSPDTLDREFENFTMTFSFYIYFHQYIAYIVKK